VPYYSSLAPSQNTLIAYLESFTNDTKKKRSEHSARRRNKIKSLIRRDGRHPAARMKSESLLAPRPRVQTGTMRRNFSAINESRMEEDEKECFSGLRTTMKPESGSIMCLPFDDYI
jgi:hypothetical protein